MKVTSRDIALVSVFAALLVGVSRLPGIPIVGTSGRIELTVILAPVIGIILGPWLGGLAVFLGDLISWIIPSTTFFGLLMLPCGLVAAVTSGALTRRKGTGNWKLSAAILGVLNALWYLTPVGREVFFYPFMHLAALAIVILLRKRIADLLQGDAKWKLTAGTALSSYAGIMANHMIGNLIFIASVGWFIQLKAIKDAVKALGFFWLESGLPSLPKLTKQYNISGLGELFILMLPISVVERALFTAIATFLGSGLILALHRSGLVRIGGERVGAAAAPRGGKPGG